MIMHLITVVSLLNGKALPAASDGLTLYAARPAAKAAAP